VAANVSPGSSDVRDVKKHARVLMATPSVDDYDPFALRNHPIRGDDAVCLS